MRSHEDTAPLFLSTWFPAWLSSGTYPEAHSAVIIITVLPDCCGARILVSGERNAKAKLVNHENLEGFPLSKHRAALRRVDALLIRLFLRLDAAFVEAPSRV